MNTKKHILSAIILSVFSALAIASSSDSKNDTNNSNTSNRSSAITEQNTTQNSPDPELEAITKKLKVRASRDWPNDYTTQEYWINEQLEAYQYMKTIPDDNIKKQAQRDWPLDFTTQKYWYNEQIQARERLSK